MQGCFVSSSFKQTVYTLLKFYVILRLWFSLNLAGGLVLQKNSFLALVSLFYRTICSFRLSCLVFVLFIDLFSFGYFVAFLVSQVNFLNVCDSCFVLWSSFDRCINLSTLIVSDSVQNCLFAFFSSGVHCCDFSVRFRCV